MMDPTMTDEERKKLCYRVGFDAGFAATRGWTDRQFREANPPLRGATSVEKEFVRDAAAWLRRFADVLDESLER